MHTQKLYGSSDDLIELEGDVREEFDGEGPMYLRFSTGTYVKIRYGDEGVWKIEVLAEGDAKIEKLFGLPDNNETDTNAGQYHGDGDAPCYSDVLIVRSQGPITLESHGRKPLKQPHPKLGAANQIIKLLDDYGGFDSWWDEIESDDQNEILEALAKLLEKL